MTNLRKTYKKSLTDENLGGACDYQKILQKSYEKRSYAKLMKNLRLHYSYLTKTKIRGK